MSSRDAIVGLQELRSIFYLKPTVVSILCIGTHTGSRSEGSEERGAKKETELNGRGSQGREGR